MQIFITDIADNIHQDDEQLNDIISTYLFSQGIESTVSQWRLDNYIDLRRWAYPDKEDYLDGIVKLSSSDETVQTEGQEQIDTYTTACLAVKARFPKE